MKSGLYRIEVQANCQTGQTADRTNLPEPDCCAMITHQHGITFAKLHPLRIVAKPEKKDPGPCDACERLKNYYYLLDKTGDPVRAKYCINCGRPLNGEEAAKE